MHKASSEFEYTGYGCPDTEMWQRRAEFEAQCSPNLSLAIRKDAPHYDSHYTRVAYFLWCTSVSMYEWEKNNAQ